VLGAADCPICGHREWAKTEHDLLLREADPRIIRGGGLQVDAFVCHNCGFVRLHRAEQQAVPSEPS
jgi:hypothetical protein